MIVPRTNLCMTCICTNDWSQLYHTYISGVSVNGKITNSLILSSLSLSTMIWPELQCIGSFFLVSLLCTGVNSLDIPNIDCKFVSSDASSCLLFGFTSYYKTNFLVILIKARRKIHISSLTFDHLQRLRNNTYVKDRVDTPPLNAYTERRIYFWFY